MKSGTVSGVVRNNTLKEPSQMLSFAIPSDQFCLLTSLVAIFQGWTSRAQSSHRGSGQEMPKILRKTKAISGQFSCKLLIKKGTGVTDLDTTNQLVWSLDLSESPVESMLAPSQFDHDPQTKAITAGPSHVPSSPSPAGSNFLHKLQGRKHFLGIPTSVQISFPKRETFGDFQLNSSPLNTNSIS